MGLRLLGIAFLPLVASVVTMALNVLTAVRLQGSILPGLTHGVALGSLVVVGVLSYRWTGRASVAVGMVIASICMTSLAALLLLFWALESALE